MIIMDQDSVENNNNRKRAREHDSADSETLSPESKVVRADSFDSVLNHHSSDLEQDNADSDDSGVNSPAAKRIQDDLFNIVDESDEPVIQGLESVIKSFEEEILVPVTCTDTVAGAGVTAYSGGSQPDLGYLLEASDDELGLPPTFSAEEEKVSAVDLAVETEMSGSGSDSGRGFGEMLGFENEIPNYDSFEFGLGCDSFSNSYNESSDFVAVGGLFDYADENYVPAGVQCQPESLSAL